MEKYGCLHCLEQKNTYSWSGAETNPKEKIFFGSCLHIVEVLENPWWAERYPMEQVFQCDACNAVWHIKYAFPGKPPLHFSAKVIPKDKLPDFFIELGKSLSKTYTQ